MSTNTCHDLIFPSLMDTLDVSFDTDVNHLGVVIGDKSASRIIALSTSGVFIDNSLIPNFWASDNFAVDSGFQGHLYTREQDILVLKTPSLKLQDIEKVRASITLNSKIWDFFTGTSLAGADSPIILVSDDIYSKGIKFPDNIFRYTGNMNEAAKWQFISSKSSYLAFIFNRETLQQIGIYNHLHSNHKKAANSISLLMDKNECMQLLQKEVTCCAQSYPINESATASAIINNIPTDRSYVFKPSGGAAGIGLFPTNLVGGSVEQITRHMDLLRRTGKLPDRFQIQEFIPGNIHGCSACFWGDNQFEILEIHDQMISKYGRCTGSRWTLEIVSTHQENVLNFYKQIATVKQLNLRGLICLDFIQDKVIEVNPRITASAPIAHILRMKNFFKQKCGTDFKIRQIDVNTNIALPFEMIINGEFWKLVQYFWEYHKVICLPQGINPYGPSRMIFINDDSGSSSQKRFLRCLQ